MVRGTEFFVFYFFCVALGLIISGLYLIIKRFLLRHNGTPVTIVSILPRVTKEIPFRVIGADRYIYGYDIKYILHKDSRVTTAKAVQPANGKADEDQYKNQLSYDEGRTMLRYIEKDKTLLLNNIRYQKETSDLTNSFLQQMQAAMRRELELKYHKYGERAIGSNHNKVILGNITFDDSALTENK